MVAPLVDHDHCEVVKDKTLSVVVIVTFCLPKGVTKQSCSVRQPSLLHLSQTFERFLGRGLAVDVHYGRASLFFIDPLDLARRPSDKFEPEASFLFHAIRSCYLGLPSSYKVEVFCRGKVMLPDSDTTGRAECIRLIGEITNGPERLTGVYSMPQCVIQLACMPLNLRRNMCYLPSDMGVRSLVASRMMLHKCDGLARQRLCNPGFVEQ